MLAALFGLPTLPPVAGEAGVCGNRLDAVGALLQAAPRFINANGIDCHNLGLSGEDVVVSVNQLDLHLVFAGRKIGYVDCVVVAGICPPPDHAILECSADRQIRCKQAGTTGHTITTGGVASMLELVLLPALCGHGL